MATHLFVRSGYTVLNSTISIQELVSYTKQLGYQSIALCDHNVMYGSVFFYDCCIKEGIKPIIGMELDCQYEDKII